MITWALEAGLKESLNVSFIGFPGVCEKAGLAPEFGYVYILYHRVSFSVARSSSGQGSGPLEPLTRVRISPGLPSKIVKQGYFSG